MAWAFGLGACSRSRIVAALLCLGVGGSCGFSVDAPPVQLESKGVGISVDIVNGQPAPLKLLAGQSAFYVQRLNLEVRQERYPAADVLAWLGAQSGFSVLDWTGIRQVKTDWEVESAVPTYEEISGHLGAYWMDHQAHVFTLQPMGPGATPIGSAVTLQREHYVINRRTALSWSTEQPAKGDDGANRGDYAALTVTSGGAFAGPKDDIYLLQVEQGGGLDGSAKLRITSLRGDHEPVPPGPPGTPPPTVAVVDGEALPLGVAGYGATITFGAAAGQTVTLEKGDRWIVRCNAKEKSVAAAEATIHATRHAMARVFFSVPRQSAPLLELGPKVSSLRLQWSADLEHPVDIPVSHEASDFGYGFVVATELSKPKNGSYFTPGETVQLALKLSDGAGKALHDPEQLPTYREFVQQRSNGIQYFNLANSGTPAGNGFFAEARLNIFDVGIAGPRDKLASRYDERPLPFFVKTIGLPEPGEVVYPGFAKPELWDTPIPAKFSITLPKDANPGTYVAFAKASRHFMGERINRITDVAFQVGTATPTRFHDKSGNCRVCHVRDAALVRLRHGTKQDRLCVICHTFEHGVIPEHVHAIHFLSPNYVVPRNDCSLCHLKEGSNTRASEAVCSSCHQSIHPGEPLVQAHDNRHQACATSCHVSEPMGHVRLAPIGEEGDR